VGSEEIAKGCGVLEELWEAAPTERFLNCTDEQVLRDWRSPAACEYGPGDAEELEICARERRNHGTAGVQFPSVILSGAEPALVHAAKENKYRKFE